MRGACPGAASPVPQPDPHPALRATFSQREKDQDHAGNPPPARQVSEANPLTPHHFLQPAASFPRRRKTPRHNSPIPSVGRASDPRSSMAAGCGRAMKPGRRRVRGSLGMSMDGIPLLAARLGTEPLLTRSARSAVRSSRKGGPGRRQGPRTAASRPARGKRLRGAVCFVKTVTLQQHRARPGRSAPSPTRLSASGKQPCATSG